MTATYDITIEQGQTYTKRVGRNAVRVDGNGDPVRDGNQQLQYDPVDMTGWSGHMQVRPDFGVPAVLDITEDNNGADGWLEFGDGFVTIHIIAVKTYLLRNGMVYDLLGWIDSANVDKVLKGIIILEPGVTQ